jgi:hypothetical protein
MRTTLASAVLFGAILSAPAFAAPNLDVTPGMIDFGLQPELVTCAAQQVLVTNTGDVAANITSVDFSGPQAMWFAVSGPIIPTVTPQGSVTINLVATPKDVGPGTATVTLHFDDLNHPTSTVALAVTGSGGKLTVTPGLLDFGAKPDFVVSPGTITLGNAGNAPVTVFGVGLNDPNNVFGIMPPLLPTPIPPNGSLTLDVYFGPMAPIPYQASIDVTTDDPQAKMVKILLAGTGETATFTLTPTEVNFGPIPLGKTVGQPVSLLNNGTASVDVAKISVENGEAGDFAIDQMGPFQLAPGKSQVIHVTFTPTAKAVRLSTMVIQFADTFPTVNFQLKGIGNVPQVELAPWMPIDFGEVSVGTTSLPTVVMVKNIGSASAIVSSITSSDPQFVVDFTGTGKGILGDGQTSFKVAFAPTGILPNPATGVVTVVVSDGVTSESLMLDVRGTPTPAAVKNPSMGGGCSIGTAPPRALALLGLALLLLLVRASGSFPRRSGAGRRSPPTAS